VSNVRQEREGGRRHWLDHHVFITAALDHGPGVGCCGDVAVARSES
jgi:hypothetical protein